MSKRYEIETQAVATCNECGTEYFGITAAAVKRMVSMHLAREHSGVTA